MAMSERERIKALVDRVPDKYLDAVGCVLAGLADDPVARALEQAPLDDEPVTEEDIAAEAEADEDIAAGRVYSHEEAKRMMLAD